MMLLSDTKVGKIYVIEKVQIADADRKRRIKSMGFVTGTEITPIAKISKKGPATYKMRGRAFALSKEDAENITVHLK